MQWRSENVADSFSYDADWSVTPQAADYKFSRPHCVSEQSGSKLYCDEEEQVRWHSEPGADLSSCHAAWLEGPGKERLCQARTADEARAILLAAFGMHPDRQPPQLGAPPGLGPRVSPMDRCLQSEGKFNA